MITIHADELRPGMVVRAGVIKGDRERPVAVPVDVAIALGERPPGGRPFQLRGADWGGMKSGVVEGEPGIFPDPIARLLRAIGRLIPPRRREATRPPDELETGDPEQDRHQQ